MFGLKFQHIQPGYEIIVSNSPRFRAIFAPGRKTDNSALFSVLRASGVKIELTNLVKRDAKATVGRAIQKIGSKCGSPWPANGGDRFGQVGRHR